MSLKSLHSRLIPWIVWALRLLVGAVFVFSGISKAIDIWGLTFKIEEYFTVWGVDMPRTIVVMAALALATTEFVLGLVMMLGLYKRSSVWLMICMMAGLLPLTLYIYVSNPVSDCGCFGDALHISNGATLLKNLVLTAALIYLACYNRRYAGVISPYSQWLVVAAAYIYSIAVALWGYNVQPLVDFRSFKEGSAILGDAAQSAMPQFVYERDGETRTFDADELPDSTWTFVERLDPDIEIEEPTAITILEADEDVTEDVIATQGEQIVIVVPQGERADVSYTYLINELNRDITDRGGSLIEVGDFPEDMIESWSDLSMAEYPIYQAESTTLKELARGTMSAVYLRDGVIVWKRTLNSIMPDLIANANSADDILPSLKINGNRIFGWLSLSLLGFLLLVFFIDRSGLTIKWTLKRLKNAGNPKNISNFAENKSIQSNKIKYSTMRKNIVAGNWKMNTTLPEGIKLAKEVNEALKAVEPKCDVVICVPFTHLASINEVIDKNALGLGAENCADHRSGAYTGEVSAAMVASTGANYVILGHSERRQYYGETSETLREKLALAFENNLTPIFCIGEVLEERENGTFFDVVKAQIVDALFHLSAEDFAKVILAYEPVWAIGTGKTATDDQAEEMHAFIRSVVAEKYGNEVAENTSILYGGSCKPSNAKALFAKPNVDGGLIGGASLDAESFMGIVTAF